MNQFCVAQTLSLTCAEIAFYTNYYFLSRISVPWVAIQLKMVVVTGLVILTFIPQLTSEKHNFQVACRTHTKWKPPPRPSLRDLYYWHSKWTIHHQLQQHQ